MKKRSDLCFELILSTHFLSMVNIDRQVKSMKPLIHKVIDSLDKITYTFDSPLIFSNH
jgi:hypothetical protein